VVFLGYDKVTKEDVAIKVEKEENEEVKSLDREVLVLQRIQGVAGIPKLYWSGSEHGFNVLILSLLGKDLAAHMKALKKFSLKTTLMLAK
jgi:casein kinase 1/casein kinase 1 alpha